MKTKKTKKKAAPPPEVSPDSKTAELLKMIRRPKGATLQDLMERAGWQAHSVRGFVSGTLRKKLGLDVKSERSAKGLRTYSIA